MKTVHSRNVVHIFVLTSLLLTLLGSAAFPTTSAHAAGIWYVATTGDDANSCSDIAAPCLTINAALGKAADGDTIEVAAGTYPNSGGAAIQIEKDIILLGGWDTAFENQTGHSVISGGGIGVYSNPTVTLDNFTISGSSNGGVYMSSGALTINDSTISDNYTSGYYGYGGGIYISSGALITINNSTISGNISTYGSGGGIYVSSSGMLTINNSTISNNRSAQVGGGIFDYYGTVAIRNSIIANNTAEVGPDCLGSIEISDHNIIGNDTDCTIVADLDTQFNVDPVLGVFLPLRGYFPLLPGSPAINAGNPMTCMPTDQRGVARTDGCDIGAYEYTIPGTVTSLWALGGNNQRIAPGFTATVPFRVIALDLQGSPVPSVEVLLTAPSSGASGTFADTGTNTTSALTDISGIASASAFTANDELGLYTVSASVDAVAPIDFSLENVAWYVAPFGDDANSCSARVAPCLTINAALGKAASGDTIEVAAGTYKGSGPEVVLIEKDIALSGGWDATFESQTGSSVISGGSISVNSNPTVTLDNFTINGSTSGGVRIFSGILTINNSTISNNTTIYGGGIYISSGALTINNSTISDNAAQTGGGILIVGGTTTIQNSIIANNTATSGPDCSGVIEVSEHNIIGNSTGCTVTTDLGTQFNINPMLGTFLPLQGYIPLLPDSPAINAGVPATCLPTDQRGVARVDGCDIGAYEYTIPGAVTSLAVVSGNNQRTIPGFTFVTPFKAVALDAQGSPVPDVEVFFTAPASGASGTFADTGTNTTSVFTDAGGIATTSTFTANHELGLYTVVSSIDGIAPIDFSMENTAWFVAPSGDDANSCATFAAPCLTINAALGKAMSGDTILIAAGTYTNTGTEVVRINKDITLLGGWDADYTLQNDRSVIDGQGIRRGVTVESGTVTMDHFRIQNGYHDGEGGGLRNAGVLILENSIVRGNISHWMGGGIFNAGTLTINNTTIASNSAGVVGRSGFGGGGGIENYNGTTTLNNSAISNNTLVGGLSGSGIYVYFGGEVIMNNSTVSGNTGGGGQGIFSTGSSSVILNNSTIANNQSFGVESYSEKITLQNTLIAGNGGADCFLGGMSTSLGYNLIGNSTGCNFISATGDLVGTSTNPIDPRLSPLQDNGGPTFTHALLAGSPAINAGNPADPGSGGNSCPATDQRGVARPVGSACDIGAYELDIPVVASVKRVSPNPVVTSSVDFTVTFSEAVTGVDAAAPFSDFALTTTGVTDAAIISVTGSDDIYTVTVNTGSGSGNGTIHLDVVDDDSILDASGKPLGGIGTGNGDFTSGETYTLLKVPTPFVPVAALTDTTPTYKWSVVPNATKYQYVLLKGAKTIYSKTIAASACGTGVCSQTPTTKLDFAAYRWKVRAMINGVWANYSPYKAFVVSAAKPGYWKSPGLEFYVTKTTAKVDNFAISVYVYGCGGYKITHTRLVPVIKKNFQFTGSFYANGTFANPGLARGLLGLNSFYIPGCGLVSGGPFYWSAIWKNNRQPTAITATLDKNLLPSLDKNSMIMFIPELEKLVQPFTVERISP